MVGQGETAYTAKPVALHSRKFSNAKMNYGTKHKEALAIIDALTVFYHLLANNKFLDCYKSSAPNVSQNKHNSDKEANQMERVHRHG